MGAGTCSSERLSFFRGRQVGPWQGSTAACAAGGVARQGYVWGRPGAWRYIRVHVCVLQSTLSTQPFILSVLPVTAPEPVYVLSVSGSVISPV
jgi:hypothetical protein